MSLEGSGFLALWNDNDLAEYNFWHTREHVIERLTIPGILAVRRYVEGDGALPKYFSLYALRDVDVLGSAAYRQLLVTPTAWSARMRPGMRRFLRYGCGTLASVGAGIGGLTATGLVRLGADKQAAARFLTTAAAGREFSAAHLGAIDETVASVPFNADGPAKADPANAVLILEGYDSSRFADAACALARSLHAAGHCEAVPDLTTYRLGFEIGQAAISGMLPFTPPEA